MSNNVFMAGFSVRSYVVTFFFVLYSAAFIRSVGASCFSNFFKQNRFTLQFIIENFVIILRELNHTFRLVTSFNQCRGALFDALVRAELPAARKFVIKFVFA